MMSRRRVPVFYIVLICFTVVFLLALAVFLFVGISLGTDEILLGKAEDLRH